VRLAGTIVTIAYIARRAFRIAGNNHHIAIITCELVAKCILVDIPAILSGYALLSSPSPWLIVLPLALVIAIVLAWAWGLVSSLALDAHDAAVECERTSRDLKLRCRSGIVSPRFC
jgi:hypothetical protein